MGEIGPFSQDQRTSESSTASGYLPVYFFISAIIAGLSMVIFEGSLAHKHFHDKMDETHLAEADGVTLGFGKAAAFVLFGYFVIKVIGLAVDNNWHYLTTGWGVWYLVEIVGFVLLPCYLYAVGARDKNIKLIRRTSGLAVLGIILNRLNISLIAFNYHLPSSERYFPHWMEIGITLFVVTIGVLVYRFIVTHMPILYQHPDYQEDH